MQPDGRTGQVLRGKYRLEAVLGAGAMGEVYRAVNTAIGRTVAIKMLHPEAMKNEEVVARFLQEGRAANLVRHRNIVEILDVDRDEDGVPFLVQEFLEGQDLTALLDLRLRLSLQEIMELVTPAVSAVGAAHRSGLVHRDIKPDNIFLANRDGTVIPKVLDFGVSKVVDHDDFKKTQAEFLVGTPPYMSPEQIQAPLSVDARTDVWAFGVLLYEATTGRRPFDGEVAAEIFSKICLEDPTPIQTIVPGASPKLIEVIGRCLQRNPDERFEDCSALAIEMLELETAGQVVEDADPTVADRSSGVPIGWGELDLKAESVPPPGPASRPPPPPTALLAAPKVPQELRVEVRKPSRPTPPQTDDLEGLGGGFAFESSSYDPGGHTGEQGASQPSFGGGPLIDSGPLTRTSVPSAGRSIPARRPSTSTGAHRAVPSDAPAMTDVVLGMVLVAGVTWASSHLGPTKAAALLEHEPGLSLVEVMVSLIVVLVAGFASWGVLDAGMRRGSMELSVASLGLIAFTIALIATIVTLALPKLPFVAAVDLWLPQIVPFTSALSCLGFGVFAGRSAYREQSARPAFGGLLALGALAGGGCALMLARIGLAAAGAI